MFNRSTGKFEARKRFNSTNQEIIGIGSTQDEARKDLKTQLDALRVPPSLFVPNPPLKAPVEPTGKYISSPGYTTVQFESGKVGYRYMPNRQVQVLARPDLAQAIREGIPPSSHELKKFAQKLKKSRGEEQNGSAEEVPVQS